MTGKFVKQYTPRHSKEGPPVSLKNAAKITVVNKPKTRDLMSDTIELNATVREISDEAKTAVLLSTVTNNPATKEQLDLVFPKGDIPAGHNCLLCGAVATCGLLNKVSENNGDNPIAKRIKAIQELKQTDPYFMEKVDEETRESLIRQKMGLPFLNKSKSTPKKDERPPETRSEFKIGYVRQLEKIRPETIVPIKEKPAAGPKQETKQEAKPYVKIPEQKIKTELPIQPIKTVDKKKPVIERPKVVEPNIPGGLPENIKKKFWKKTSLTEAPRVKEAKPVKKTRAERRVLETFKKSVNEFLSKTIRPKVRQNTNVAPMKRVFDRLIHLRREGIKKPVVKELKRRVDKIDFPIPLKLGFLTLLPLSRIDRKFKPRRLFFSRSIKPAREWPEIKVELKTKKIEQKTLKKPESVKSIKARSGPKEAGARPVSKPEILVEKIKQALLKEKQIPFAPIILPVETQDSHEVIPVGEKVFFKFINLSTRIREVLNLFSAKENKKTVEQLLTYVDADISPSPEEIKTTLKNRANGVKAILWYIAQTLLSFNKLNVYLLEA